MQYSHNIHGRSKCCEINKSEFLLFHQMYGKGFKNLDAIDASAQMLEKAKNLGVYENVYLGIIGPKKLSIPDSK